MINEFDDDVVVADQLKVFQEHRCSRGVVIKQMKNKYNEKDALVFKKKKLVAIIECKKRTRIFPDYILEVKKVLHWMNNYPELDFIYLNRLPIGDFYLNVKDLGLEKCIKDGSYKSLDGTNGITFEIGSRTDRNKYTDYNREWLKISPNLFKKVIKPV